MSPMLHDVIVIVQAKPYYYSELVDTWHLNVSVPSSEPSLPKC